MLNVFGKAALVSAIFTFALLFYSIIAEVIDVIKSKRNIHDKPYQKDFFHKLINTIIIFYPLFFLVFSLIFTVINKLTTEF